MINIYLPHSSWIHFSFWKDNYFWAVLILFSFLLVISSNVPEVSRSISIEQFLLCSIWNVDPGSLEMWKDMFDAAFCAEIYGNVFLNQVSILQISKCYKVRFSMLCRSPTSECYNPLFQNKWKIYTHTHLHIPTFIYTHIHI